jgi:opacity protein-like surface antigen
MKKVLLTVLAAAGLVSVASSQDIKINTYFGGGFEDTFASEGSIGYAKTTGGFTWGLGVEKMLTPTLSVDVTYMMQNGKLKVHSDNFPVSEPTFINEHATSIQQNSNFILAGANKYFREDKKWQPFIGGQAGINVLFVGDMNDKATYLNDVYTYGRKIKFAWGVRAGANYDINDHFAIKLQGALLSSVGVYNNQGAEGFFGSPVESGSYKFNKSLYQANITAGLVYNITKTNASKVQKAFL